MCAVSGVQNLRGEKARMALFQLDCKGTKRERSFVRVLIFIIIHCCCMLDFLPLGFIDPACMGYSPASPAKSARSDAIDSRPIPHLVLVSTVR